MNKLAIAACLSIFTTLASSSLSAQETPRFNFDIGAGFTNPVGNTGRHLDTGWNLRGGAGVNFSPYFGVNLNLGYDYFNINTATLNNIGVPGGDYNIFSARIDPIVHLTPKRHVDFYVTGGGGLFHRYQEFTQPTVSIAPVYDRFFGFYPAAFQTTQVLASSSINKLGVDGGVGVAFGSKWRGKFFAEARYNRMYVRDSHADYLPVSFGYRW